MLLQAYKDLLINPGMQWVEHICVQLLGAITCTPYHDMFCTIPDPDGNTNIHS